MLAPAEITQRLKALGLNRKWLAERSRYSEGYLRTVLAPNSRRRTDRVMAILSEKLAEAERARLEKDAVFFRASKSEAARWLAASSRAGVGLDEWIRERLDDGIF